MRIIPDKMHRQIRVVDFRIQPPPVTLIQFLQQPPHRPPLHL
jgi:hypothetical protein